MAERNRWFRIAAQVAAATYLIYAGHDLINALHHSPEVSAAYLVAEILFFIVRLIEIAGWLLVASAFGEEVDRQRLWLGVAAVVAAFVTEYVARVVYLVPYLDAVHSGDFRSGAIWTAIGTLLFAIGSWVLVTGLAPSRLGPARASRIWLGMIGITAAAAASAAAPLYQQSFYSSVHADHALTIGTLIGAVGALGLALAFLVLTARVRRPFAERESTLAIAAAAAAASFLCMAISEMVIANYDGSHGVFGWVTDTIWLTAVYRAGLAVAAFFVFLGARAAATSVAGDLRPAEQ